MFTVYINLPCISQETCQKLNISIVGMENPILRVYSLQLLMIEDCLLILSTIGSSHCRPT